jgi:hypothetical protein
MLEYVKADPKQIKEPYESYDLERVLPLQAWPRELVWHFRLDDIETWMRINKASEKDFKEKVTDRAWEVHEKGCLAGMTDGELTRAVATFLKEAMPFAFFGIEAAYVDVKAEANH